MSIIALALVLNLGTAVAKTTLWPSVAAHLPHDIAGGNSTDVHLSLGKIRSAFHPYTSLGVIGFAVAGQNAAVVVGSLCVGTDHQL